MNEHLSPYKFEAIVEELNLEECKPPPCETTPLGSDLDDIEAALAVIPSNDRETWLKIGMALKAELGQAGFELWDKWSSTAPNYGGTEKAWNSFKRNGVSILSLFDVAKEYGYHGKVLNPGNLPFDLESILSNLRKRADSNIEWITAAELLTTEPLPPEQILENTFDTGDKVLIVAPSKMRKTFFVLQMALALATGRKFLRWNVPKRRRVLFIQLEVKADHFQRRFQHVCRYLKITSGDVGDYLGVINGRGKKIDYASVRRQAEKMQAEVIIFDPLYQLVDGDENSAQDIKPTLLQFSALAESTGAAVLYVHHDAKGMASDRNIRDRGAGSNILGRDYDCCFALAAHRDEDDSTVVQTLLRNYRHQEDFVITWDEDGGFYQSQTLEPLKETERTRKPKEEPDLDTLEAKVQAKFAGQKMPKEILEQKIKHHFRCSREIARGLIAGMLYADKALEIAHNSNLKQKKMIEIVKPK